MSTKLKIRLSFLGAIFFWLVYAGSNIYQLFIVNYDLKVDFSHLLPQIALTLFTILTFSYYRYVISKADTLNFTDLLWKVFITGLVTTLISLGIHSFFVIFASSSVVESPLTINFFYNILTGLVMIYMISTLVVWKRLILYQKSKNLIRLWGFFEVSMGAAMIFDFFQIAPGEVLFSLFQTTNG